MTTATLIPVSGSEKDVETRNGLKAGTLRTWRSRGEGPPFSKTGRTVIYVFADVDAWLRKHRQNPEDHT